jgi:signal transduction histidine kinase
MGLAARRTPWPSANDSDLETRTRLERVLTMARIFFAIVTLGAISMTPGKLRPDEVVAFELLTGYLALSSVIAIAARLSPLFLLEAGLAIHVVDVLFATVFTFVTRGSGSPFFVFFVFVLAAAALRGGLMAMLVTGIAAVLVFVAQMQLVPAVSAAPAAETAGVVHAAYLLVLTLLLAFAAEQAQAFRAESDALSLVLSGVCGASSFTEALRVCMDQCLHHTGSATALLATQNLSAQRLYLWRARRSTNGPTTVVLEELAPTDRQTYFATPTHDMVVWDVRRAKTGSLSVRGLAATTLDTVIRTDGEFMRPVLDRHGAAAALSADVTPGPDWRARLLLLDPGNLGLNESYFLRNLAYRVGPALYNEYSIRRVRSRVVFAERARLARELHDDLIQSLIGLEMEIEVLRRGPDRTADEEARLRQIRDQLRQDIANVRDLMLRLQIVEMTGDDLLRTIAELAGRLRHETKMDVRLSSAGAVIDCVPRHCAHLARIVQEALTNIRKHSHARSVSITVAATGRGGRVTIADDGRGFRFKGRLTLAQLDASDLGPRVIKERVRSMGANLTIESNPGAGARIEVEWAKVPYA